MAPLPESTRKVSKSSRKGKSSRKYGLVSGVKCYREVRCDKDRERATALSLTFASWLPWRSRVSCISFGSKLEERKWTFGEKI